MNHGLLIMGVSGSGKSTIGSALAAQLDCVFLDADDFHPPAYREKMRAGVPLNDDDRKPWLDALCQQLHDLGNSPFVLACSALREIYRQQLLLASPPMRLVWLHGPSDLIADRLRSRHDHFMPPSLLQSQFDALEAPLDAYPVDISLPIDQIVTQLLHRFFSHSTMSDYLVIPRQQHDDLVIAAYQSRGYDAAEAAEGAKLAAEAARHGIRTHHALKALHLDHLFGSATGGCVPGAEIEVLPSRFPASEIWNAHKKLGQSVAYRAIERGIELADQYGIAQISVDNAFHYLWGGGYVMEAAERGYLAYTNCTSTLAEVVPFGGKFPTLGTNPHSWGMPTMAASGFPLVIDWATSTVAMGRVQALKREGKSLPPGAAVDKDGNPTTDPHQVASLLPFGGHKGYGLSLINELMAALIGGSLPTHRGRPVPVAGEKSTSAFYFQIIHPDALNGRDFAFGRSQMENLTAVVRDILGHGNENAMLPGQIEAQARKQSDACGGLLFTAAEVAEFNEINRELGRPEWNIQQLASAK
ncbi:MAG: hypothetical protein RL117_622 [Verrucomicrobiota bacterium]